MCESQGGESAPKSELFLTDMFALLYHIDLENNPISIFSIKRKMELKYSL